MIKAFDEMVKLEMRLSDFNELCNNASLRDDSDRRSTDLFIKLKNIKEILEDIRTSNEEKLIKISNLL